jgi:hypothetical protein
MRRGPHAWTCSAEQKIINDFKSPPFAPATSKDFKAVFTTLPGKPGATTDSMIDESPT